MQWEIGLCADCTSPATIVAGPFDNVRDAINESVKRNTGNTGIGPFWYWACWEELPRLPDCVVESPKTC